jgi:uncharacterized protein YbaR (Trm112 family)
MLETRQNVIQFPIACPKCAARDAMPLKVGTIAEQRTQVHLQCPQCRHEWAVEVNPPVLFVNPGRAADHDQPTAAESDALRIHTSDRRRPSPKSRRMRAGQCGLLRSTDRTSTVIVLYSFDERRVHGRLRLLDPRAVFPAWLARGSRLWLAGDDGQTARIRITGVHLPRDGQAGDEYFAEYVTHQAAQ